MMAAQGESVSAKSWGDGSWEIGGPNVAWGGMVVAPASHPASVSIPEPR